MCLDPDVVPPLAGFRLFAVLGVFHHVLSVPSGAPGALQSFLDNYFLNLQYIIFKDKKSYRTHKTGGMKVFLLFLLDDPYPYTSF
jgi:hypothetical protein